MIYVLDINEKIVAVLDNDRPNGCPYWNDKHVEAVEDSLSTYEFEVPADHEFAKYLVGENYIVRKGYRPGYLFFKIKNVEESLSEGVYTKKVFCENAATSELNAHIILPQTLTGYTAEQAINFVLQGTGWTLAECDYNGTKDFKFENYETVLQALHEIRKQFDGYMFFSVELDGNKIVSRNVHMISKTTGNPKFRFEYKQNLKGVKRFEDTTKLCTAMYVFGKADENGNRMTIASVNGGKLYLEDLDARDRWSKNDTHIWGVYIDEEAQSPQDLLERGQKEFEKRKEPLFSYETDVLLLETLDGYEHTAIDLNDDGVVIDRSFSPVLEVTAQVIELTRSYTDPTQDKAVLGNYKPAIYDVPSIIESMRKQIESKVNIVEAKAVAAKTTAEQAQLVATDAQATANAAETVATTANETATEVKGTVDNWKHPADQTTIDGSKIYSGTISTNQIASGAVTSDKLTIGRNPNMVQNGYDSFEQYALNTDFTYLGDAQYCRVDNQFALDGKYSLRLRGGNGTNNIGRVALSGQSSRVIPVVAGQTYIGSCYVYNGNAQSLDVKIAVRTGNPVNDPNGTNDSLFYSQTITINSSSGWKRLWVKFTVPTGHTYAGFQLEHTGVNISCWFDCFQLELCEPTQTEPSPWKPAATTVVNGSNITSNTITGDKIVANSITSSHIAAGAINASHIATGSIDSTKISTSGITADKIQGGTLTLGGLNNIKGRLEVQADDQTPIHFIDSTQASFANAYAGYFKSPTVPFKNSGNYTIYVDPVNGNDSNDGLTTSTQLKTLNEAFSRLPDYNDGNITILISSTAGTWSEGNQIILSGIAGGGSVTIDFQSRNNVMQTRLKILQCQNIINIQNGTIKNNEVFASNQWYGCLHVEGCTKVNITNMYFDARQNSKLQYCISIFSSFAKIQGCEAYNGANAQVVAAYGGFIDLQGCIGSGGNYGVYVVSSAIVGGAGNIPTGSQANVQTAQGGVCNVAIGTGGFTPNSGTAPTPPPTSTTTTVFNAIRTASWRDTYGWRTDNDYVYQGQYASYGNHRGFIFFDDSSIRSALSGKTVKSARLFLSRRPGGTNSAQSINLYTHNYTTSVIGTGGTPTVTLVQNNVGSYAVYDKKWISIPISAVTAIQNGTAKGLAFYTSSGSPYCIFDGYNEGSDLMPKLEITYEG